MPAPLAKALRVAGYTFVSFVAFSLVSGGLEGTAFETNLSYGVKTGTLGAVVLGAILGALEARKHRRERTSPIANDTTTETETATETETEGDAMTEGKTSTATFGAGCFWGVEAVFRQVDGVTGTTVGYSGGTTENPTYRQVCGHGTGHAEAVEVEFDPERVPYERLLDVFWDIHDPTTLNRQGLDVGDQYRSVIFTHDDSQQAAAVTSKEKLEAAGRHRGPVVTQIVPAARLWPAEEYHQRYLEKNGHRLPRVPAARS